MYYTFSIVAIALLYAVLAWRSRALALALLIVALPAYQLRFSIGSIPSTLLEGMALLLFGAWLLRAWRGGELPPWRKQSADEHVYRYPFWRQTIALLVIAFIAAGIAGFTNDALGILKAYFIEPAMVFIVAVNVLKHEKNRSLVVGAIAASMLWVSLVAWYQFATGSLVPLAWQGTGRVTGPFAYPNALGLYLGPLIPLLVGWLAMRRQWADKAKPWWQRVSPHCYLGMAAVVAALGAIVLAKSDGAMLGVAAALAVMAALHSRATRLALLAVAVACAAFFMLAPAGLQEKVGRKIAFEDLDGQIRLMLWQETYTMLTASPARFVFGAGLAQFQTALEPYHTDGLFYNYDNNPDFRNQVVWGGPEYKEKYWQPVEVYLYPHTIILNFWSELGLAGLVVVLVMLAHYAIVNWRGWRAGGTYALVHWGLLGALVVLVVHGAVDVPYFKNDLAMLFWLLLALAGVLRLSDSTHTHTTNQ